jgi:hypothetical protein
MPAVGVRPTEWVVTDVVGKKFATAGHLAFCAGPPHVA